MIEFVMSRVWMVIVGLAMAAVILAAFGGLNENIADSRSMAGAEAIAGIIDDLEDEEGSVELRIEIDEMIADRGTVLIIHPGSIWVQDEAGRRAVACSSDIVLLDGGQRVDELRLLSGDVVVIRASAGEIQLEKVSTM